VFLSLLSIIVVLAVALCAALGLRPWNQAPSKSDLIGTWQASDPDMQIIVDASGKITFKNIPKGAIEVSGEKAWDRTPVKVAGSWDTCWNYWYLVQCGYSLPDGYDGALESEGNFLTGYTISLIFGQNYEHSYDFHRVHK
jgi:hypothetical protein